MDDPLLALAEFLQPYPQEVQDVALAARTQLKEMLPNTTEVIWDATTAVCDGFGYTHKSVGSFVNTAVYAKHVTLVFSNGASLPDPHQILKGEGSRVRHIRLQGIETLELPEVQSLIQAASDHAEKPIPPLEPTVIIKVMAGPKKRPKS